MSGYIISHSESGNIDGTATLQVMLGICSIKAECEVIGLP
jgi:hypothetical protein